MDLEITMTSAVKARFADVAADRDLHKNLTVAVRALGEAERLCVSRLKIGRHDPVFLRNVRGCAKQIQQAMRLIHSIGCLGNPVEEEIKTPRQARKEKKVR